MKSVITNKGYGIYLNSITKDELESLKTALTVKPLVLADYDFGEDNSFPMYRLSDTRIYIPTFYGIEKYGPTESKVRTGQNVDFEFKGELKEHQTNFCEVLLKQIKTNGSCIANMVTGGGKTVCALWLTAQLNKRTLIVVHKEFLLNQWIERIKEFLPNATIGIIKQSKCDIDKDIVIGMIQSITSRDYPQDTFNSFGCFIADEVHHLAAKVFGQVLFKCRSKYNLGLSATPKRLDGLTKVLYWSLGQIIRNEIISEIQTPLVKTVEAEYSTDIKPKFNFKGNLNAPNMINQLVVDPTRNKQIIDEIVLLSKEGRNILVLSGRRNHCNELEELCIKALKALKPQPTTSLYMGGMKNWELDESNKADIIFATYQAVSEGYDNPKLDSLIMATGMGNVQQSIGRILRRKNKFRPLVVDITDKEFFGGQARRRRQFYKKNNYVLLDEEVKHKIIDSDEESEGCLFDN